MTNEQAMGIIDECICLGKITTEAENYAFWETIREAIDKQIPKKPNIEVDKRCLRDMYCKNCNRYFGIYGDIYIPSNSEYCPYCGQAIDWSEE